MAGAAAPMLSGGGAGGDATKNKQQTLSYEGKFDTNAETQSGNIRGDLAGQHGVVINLGQKDISAPPANSDTKLMIGLAVAAGIGVLLLLFARRA